MSQIVSDDFSDESLNPMWVLTGTGASQNVIINGNEAYLELAVPEGTYNAWDTNTAVRSMQSIDNEDFQLEAHFLSDPVDDYQNQGILIEQNDQNFVRFDVYNDGNQLYLFGAATTNGDSDVAFKIKISGDAADYLRVTRVGDLWTFEYSSDGVTWNTAGSFTYALNVNAVGPFAAAQNNGYTAQVDYFFNSASPIMPEDSLGTDGNAIPLALADVYDLNIDTTLIENTPGILANDTDGDGDSLTAVLVTDVANGTLTLNADGSFSYTPDNGFSGTDSFVYRADDGTDQSSDVTVTINVQAEAASLVSDDFNSGSLDPMWVLTGPAGSQSIVVDGAEVYLELVVPTGTFNAWDTNTAVRSLQTVANENFQLETRFLSAPVDDYQNQGILIEQDDQNFIRFDVYNSGSQLYLFGATTTSGDSSVAFKIKISDGDADYMRVTRSGDLWNFEYSADGVNWNTAGSYSHAMVVNAVGPFGAAQNNGFTAEVDYFFNTASPIVPEDGQGSGGNNAPVGVDDSYNIDVDGTLVESLPGVLANDSDGDGDSLSAVLVTDVANGTLTLNVDGSFSYTPDNGFVGSDSFIYRADDGTDQSADVTVTINVQAPLAALVSDDFSGASVDPIWVLAGGGSQNLAVNGAEAYLELVVPTGAFNAWDTNTAVRSVQAITDEDFQLEARFLSTPTGDYQNQGILVEQDDQNFIRFDVYSDGSQLYLFGASTTNGDSSVEFSIPVNAGDAEYLRVSRAGDLWAFEYSADGENWTTAGSYTHAMTVTGAGPFAASQSNGFTAQVDYFFNTAAPVLPEDGQGGSGNSVPVGVDDNYSIEVDGTLIESLPGVLANDMDGDSDSLSAVLVTDVANGTLTLNADGSFSYTPDNGFVGSDSFVYRADDGTDQSSDVTVTINVQAPLTAPVSDDFSDDVLDSMWVLGGPAGAQNLASDGTDAYLEIVVPTGSFNAWNTNTAVRSVQAVLDEDFQLEARFLSNPSGDYQDQGILIEEDDQNFIRFDVYSDGSSTYVFGGVIDGGSSQVLFNIEVPVGGAEYLRVDRSGDVWTFEYSADGENWTTAGTTTYALNVTGVGPYASAQSGGYVAQVDYFFNTATPIDPEDPLPSPPEPQDDTLTTALNTALVISVAADLLINDTDPNGDALNLSSFIQPLNGTLTDNGDGTLTYTPNNGFSGIDTFTYTVTDGGFTSQASVLIGVGNSDPAPVVDEVSTDEDSAVLVSVLGNDSDPDGDAIMVVSVGAASNGTVTLNNDGTIEYTPDENFNGVDSFEYTVSDGISETTSTVQVTVNPVQDDPNAVDDVLVTQPDTSREININLDLLLNDTDGDGDVLSVQSFTQPANGTLIDNGDGTLTYIPDPGYSGLDTFTYVVTDGSTTDTATVNVSVNDTSIINVWYGAYQKFGNVGEAQKFVNILGNVDLSIVASLSYSINGGASRELSLGPDTRRLEENGDFNVDIDFAELDGSATDDVVTITAVLVDGSEYSYDVVIDYEHGNDWDPNYSIDWSIVSNLQDVVQIIDGDWTIDNGQLRTALPGYDRIVAIGDENWDNFEATFTITINEMHEGTSRDGAGFGLGMLWNGHTDDPIPGRQPLEGWNPIVSPFFNTKDGEFILHDHPDWNSPHLDNEPFSFTEGATYNIKVRVEQVGVMDRKYSFKIWEVGQPEPEEWTVEGIDQMNEPLNGSLAIIAHHWDISVGNIDVTEITGDDIVFGDDTDDVFLAVDTTQALPGAGEIDVLVGEGGSDTFVLGGNDTFYYDDGDDSTAGHDDYALIYDFESGVDQIQLFGEANDYALVENVAGLSAGTAIYAVNESGEDELVGVVENVSGLLLTSDDFEFV